MADTQSPDATEQVERVARAICKSGKFETGEGTCSLLCMQFLGDPRKSGCGCAVSVHGDLAREVLAALPNATSNASLVERALVADWLLEYGKRRDTPHVAWTWLHSAARYIRSKAPLATLRASNGEQS